MPPQKAAGGASNRGRPKGSKAAAPVVIEAETDDPFASSDDESASTNQARNGREKDADDMEDLQQARVEEEEETPEKTIPKELLTRLLHEFFTKDSTRISRDANATVGKYFDVFVREAIARTAVEKQGGFLEVEDLEKATPQLLLDL